MNEVSYNLFHSCQFLIEFFKKLQLPHFKRWGTENSNFGIVIYS